MKKYRSLIDHFSSVYIVGDDDFKIMVDGKIYPYTLTLSPEVPDCFSCRVKIGREYFYFSSDDIPVFIPEATELFMDPENENTLYLEFNGAAYETTHDAAGVYSVMIDGLKIDFNIHLFDFFNRNSVLINKTPGGYTVTIDGETVPAVKIDEYIYTVSIKNNVFSVSRGLLDRAGN